MSHDGKVSRLSRRSRQEWLRQTRPPRAASRLTTVKSASSTRSREVASTANGSRSSSRSTGSSTICGNTPLSSRPTTKVRWRPA